MQYAAKKAVFQYGITLATADTVKKAINIRNITLAIGIVVAVLVALTLWTSSPASDVAPGAAAHPTTGLISGAREMVFRLFAFGSLLLAGVRM
jgi:hypothetical protein